MLLSLLPPFSRIDLSPHSPLKPLWFVHFPREENNGVRVKADFIPAEISPKDDALLSSQYVSTMTTVQGDGFVYAGERKMVNT